MNNKPGTNVLIISGVIVAVIVGSVWAWVANAM